MFVKLEEQNPTHLHEKCTIIRHTRTNLKVILKRVRQYQDGLCCGFVVA